MTSGGLTIQIDAELAERLRARAKAAGQTVEEYVIGILRRAVEEPGFGESETQWNGPSIGARRDNGFSEDSDAYADEIDRICDEAERTGGVPFEVFQTRLRNLGQRR